MAQQLHEIIFRWPSLNAQDVVVTGTFDGWSSSTHLARTADGFEGSAHVPFGTKVAYKYIVDGRWTTADGQPTETDPIGNVNNVYSTPAAPPPAPTPASKPNEPESPYVMGTLNVVATGLAQVASQEQIAPSVSTPTAETEASALASDPEPAFVVPVPVPDTTTDSELPVEPVTPSAVPVAAPQPDVHVHLLPLMPTIAEGTTVIQAPVAEANGGPENAPSTHEVGRASVVSAEERGKALECAEMVPEEKPVEEAKLAVNGTLEEAVKPVSNESSEEEKPTANGVEGPTPVVNNSSDEAKPTSSASAIEEPKSAVNDTPEEAKPTPALNATPTKEPITNGAPPTPPVPASPSPSSKKMRFPSLSTRHSRRSSASVTEFGEAPGSPGQSKEKLDTHASRAAGETVRRKRTSIFGKIKGIFDSPHATNGHGKTNGA